MVADRGEVWEKCYGRKRRIPSPHPAFTLVISERVFCLEGKTFWKPWESDRERHDAEYREEHLKSRKGDAAENAFFCMNISHLDSVLLTGVGGRMVSKPSIKLRGITTARDDKQKSQPSENCHRPKPL